MKSLSPDARVLLIARDPIDRAWSQIRMLIREGHCADAATALANRPDVVGFSTYSAVIDRYMTVFGEDQFRIRTYDSVAGKPQEFASELMAWLGLPVEGLDEAVLSHPLHVGQDMEPSDSDYAALRAALSQEYVALAKYMPDAVEEWKNRHYGRVSTSPEY